MPIPLGVLAVAGAGGAGGGAAYELLETQILTSNQNDIVFSNLNTSYGSAYQHLQLRISSNRTNTGGVTYLYLRVNSDTTAANYRTHELYGNGTNVISTTQTSVDYLRIGVSGGGSTSVNEFGATIIDILDSFETTKNKTFRSLAGATSASPEYQISLISGLWMSTSAITTLQIFPISNQLASKTRVSLYGMRSS
jgi:hypothetical protein